MAKKNKFEHAGAPQKYSSPKELSEKIDDYFKNGVREKKVVVGHGPTKRTEMIPVPTITGLAIHLGFASRQSMYDYEKMPEFSYTIKRARLFIEREYEEMLQVGNTTGAIFALKNLGWQDKSEVLNTNVNSTELSKEEIAELNKALDDEY